MMREQMTWRNWWDGGNTSGPIATQWNNIAWPTFHVLDAKGVIRYRGVPGADVHEAVAVLIKRPDKTSSPIAIGLKRMLFSSAMVAPSGF